MIEIKLARESDGLDLKLRSDELCYIAKENEEIIGKCVFSFDGEAIRIKEVFAQNNDYSLIDGLIRSTVASLFDVAKTVILEGEGEELTKFREVSGLFEGNSTKIDAFSKTCC